MTNTTVEDNVRAHITAHHSEPWPVSWTIEIYDNGMLVEHKFTLTPFRWEANLIAKRALKKYRKNRFNLGKSDTWVVS